MKNPDTARQPGSGGLAPQFAALAHPVRLQILEWLAGNDRCQCKDVVDALPLAQSTVSQHLKVLVDAGLVDVELKRPKSHYTLNVVALGALRDGVGEFIEACCKAEACGPAEKSPEGKNCCG